MKYSVLCCHNVPYSARPSEAWAPFMQHDKYQLGRSEKWENCDKWPCPLKTHEDRRLPVCILYLRKADRSALTKRQRGLIVNTKTVKHMSVWCPEEHALTTNFGGCFLVFTIMTRLMTAIMASFKTQGSYVTTIMRCSFTLEHLDFRLGQWFLCVILMTMSQPLLACWPWLF